MAHPPDPSLSRAVGSAIRDLRAQGWSAQDLADQLGVVQPTISRWEKGGRLPALELLPRFDNLLGRPRGELLRRAGYVEDDCDVITAIRSDQILGADHKLILVEVYEAILRRLQEADQ